MNFWQLFHRASKDLSDAGRVHIPKRFDEWPDAWKRAEYKVYPRSTHVPIPKGVGTDFIQRLLARRSVHSFEPSGISLGALGGMFRAACGETGMVEGRAARAQPSGGGLYPIEMYALVFRSSDDLSAGVYHYAPGLDVLEIIQVRDFSEEEIDKLFVYPWIKNASGVVIMTAVFQRTMQKYGHRGYRFALLEAGHIGQNIYLAAPEFGLGCCAMGGTRDEIVEVLIGVDGVTEALVHGVVIGIPKR